MHYRTLGGVDTSAIGLGAMHLSTSHVPEGQAVATVHAALDAGVILIDTADAYAPDEHSVGHNEQVVAKALASYPGDATRILVATKGGHTRVAGGGWGLDGRPSYIKEACEASLRALGVEAIGLYQYHRPDPKVPYEETMGAFRELYEGGKVRMVGISNADEAQIRQAERVLGDAFVSVQNELSPRFRSSEDELAYCTERGIAFLPWSPFGGIRRAADLGQRFGAFAEVARERDATPHQVCLAWLLAKSPVLIPIPGARRPETILDSVVAADLALTGEELERLDSTG